MKDRKPELLLPAGSLDALQTALLYGADAVYAGLPELSLRASNGFTVESMARAIAQTHAAGKKIYLTLNLFSKNADIPKLADFAKTVRELKPDGLIVSDAGVFAFMRENAPEIPLHVSTQANVSSWLTVDFWKKMGAKACVLSRETTFDEICEIKRKIPDVRLEMFVHGAMCMSYSGRCLLSSYMTGRSANQGRCAQSCRWEYDVFLREKKRPDALIKVEQDERGTYFMNSKDLCLMPKLDKILKAQIDLLKIEGRNKTPYYVAVAARAYRRAIDDWFADPENWSPDKYQKMLDTLQNRGYCTGFFDGWSDDMTNTLSTQSVSDMRNAGVIRAWEKDGAVVELYHKVQTGSELIFLPPRSANDVRVTLSQVIDGFTKKQVAALSAGKKGQTLFVPLSFFKGAPQSDLPVSSVVQTPFVS